MNWTKASAMAEILSSIAILVTLIYLAIEIQQNTDATQAEIRQSTLESDQQHLQLFIDATDDVKLSQNSRSKNAGTAELVSQAFTIL